MKNKKVIIVLISMIVLIGGILFVNKIYNKSNNKHIPKKNNLAIMVKGESGEYISTDAIPKGNYILNEEKTICENNGKVLNYDSTTGKVSFSFVGSDRCSLYFDKIIDNEKPVISNLTVNDTIVTATLTDNIELSGYGISTSNTVEPTSWTTISGTTYNLSTTITTEGTYYLWVKDSSDNISISISIEISLGPYGWETILINNGGGATTLESAISYIKGKKTPDFADSSTTNEGMYAAEDDLGMSYYFRGAINNNWVKFGKDSSGNYMYWRIIRINGDGSIRMIYSGTTAPANDSATIIGTGTQIGTNTFNSSSDNPSYVGYMYEINSQYGNSTPSSIKIYLDNWYKTTTLETDTSTKNLVSDQIFCNDRSVNGTFSLTNDFDFAAYTRLVINKTPKLICETGSDKFTVNNINGNGALTYPVGLIMADEVTMAGNASYRKANNFYYLYTNQYYWTFSPVAYSASIAQIFVINSDGGLSDYTVNSRLLGVRPVISISSKVKLSGNGTYNNVYTVS